MKRPRPVGFESRLPSTTPHALDTPERVLAFCQRNGALSALGSADIEKVINSDPHVSLVFEDLGDKDAYIRHNEDDTYTIGINSSHPRNRQRFSMAHEYAHYQLHREEIKSSPDGERILHRDGRSNPREWQANRFAAEILMPEESVTRALQSTAGNLVKAGLLLKVSVAALQFRIDELARSSGG